MATWLHRQRTAECAVCKNDSIFVLRYAWYAGPGSFALSNVAMRLHYALSMSVIYLNCRANVRFGLTFCLLVAVTQFGHLCSVLFKGFKGFDCEWMLSGW